MFRPTYHEPHDDRDWEDAVYATTIDPESDGWDYGPLPDTWYGIPAVIGTDPDFPLTTRPDYLGIDRSPPLLAEEQVAATDHEPAPLVFDAQQQQAIDDCRDHLFTNISGTAGVGKTLVAKEILKQHSGVVLAATTGIASVNLGEGTTINALLHYFNTAMLGTRYMEGQLRRVIDHLRRAGIQRILIDEKSMMAGQQLTYITRAVRESNEGGVYALEDVGVGEAVTDEEHDARKRPEPLPMGITLVGDFGQLPPVPDEEEYKDPKTQERKWRKLPVQFAFDSPEWTLYAAHTTILKTIYRQDAKDFIAALHAIRAGRVVDALRFFTPDRFVDTQDDSFEGSTVLAKNDQVDRYNQLRLDALPTEKMIARSIRQGEQRPDWKQIPETLVLKEQALVMLLANRRIYDSDDRGQIVYANGDLATLVGKDEDGAWLATLFRNRKEVIVYPVTRENMVPLQPGRRKQIKLAVKAAMKTEGYRYAQELDDADYEDDTSYTRAGRAEVWDEVEHAFDDEALRKERDKAEFVRRLATQINDGGKGKFEIVGTITYMPLRAAYGCTVHKTQGLTLDRVQVNIRDPFFKQPGMLFVALSRARTAEGLRIVGDQRTFAERCRIEPRVQQWL